MEFRFQVRDNYDRSLKVKDIQMLLYSRKKFIDVATDGMLVGEVIISQGKEKCDEKNVFVIGKQKFPLKEPDEINRKIYRSRGFTAVGDDEYIEVFENRLPFLIILFGMLLIALIAVALILLAPKAPVIEPTEDLDNPLPVIDPFVLMDDIPIVETSTVPEDLPEGGGSVEISYKPKATLTLSTGEISMGYKNPASSSHDAVIELYVITEDADGYEQNSYLIARSGRIPHGSKLETMKLLPKMKDLFGKEGVYKAKYKVMFYNPTTGELALVNNELTSVSLTVYNK